MLAVLASGGVSPAVMSPKTTGGLDAPRSPFATVLDYLSTVALGDSLEDLHAEPWFTPGRPAPGRPPGR